MGIKMLSNPKILISFHLSYLPKILSYPVIFENSMFLRQIFTPILEISKGGFRDFEDYLEV